MVRAETGVVRRRVCGGRGWGWGAGGCRLGVRPNETAGVPEAVRSTGDISGHQIPKCDLCADRTECDGEAVPRCVASCPTGALSFEDEHKAEELGITMMGGRTTGEHPFKRR